MGILKRRMYKKRRNRDVERAVKAILYPPVILSAMLLFGTKKKRGKRK